MDPKACLDRAAAALRDHDRYEGALWDAYAALQDYSEWRRSGGFAPEGGDARARKLRRTYYELRNGDESQRDLEECPRCGTVGDPSSGELCRCGEG